MHLLGLPARGFESHPLRQKLRGLAPKNEGLSNRQALLRLNIFVFAYSALVSCWRCVTWIKRELLYLIQILLLRTSI